MNRAEAVPPADRPGRATPTPRERAIVAALATASALVLLFACRGAPLGVPATDDYLLLEHQRFGALDWLDSHGLAWYWRPASRQLYYSLVGPWLTETPTVAAALHLGLLLVTFVGMWAFARRFLSARGAIVAAAFPLIVEPARTLLGWPSGAQHLLAIAGVSVALAAAAWGRLVPALGGAAIAITSIESAALVLPALPFLPVHESTVSRRRWLIAVAALGAVWLTLRFAAAFHGVAVPDTVATPMMLEIPTALRRALVAQLGLEDMPSPIVLVAALGYATALGWAVWSVRRSAAGEPRSPAGSVDDSARPLASPAERWLVLGGLLWWLAGTAPLAGVPDWNAWRSSLPGLGLGVALAVPLARGRAWPAGVFVGMRVALLLISAPAAATVTNEPPDTVSQLSFVRLARLQRTLEASRAALAAPPGLPRSAHVHYWGFPGLSEVGFGGSSAIRVWFNDPTMTWEPFGEGAGYRDTSAIVLAYDSSLPQLAVRIRPEVQRRLCAADIAVVEGHLDEGDRWLAEALVNQPEPVSRLQAVVLGSRVLLQLRLGRLARADSLHRLSANVVPKGEWQRTEVAIALARADSVRARHGLRDALADAPDDPQLREVARLLAVQ